VLASTDDHLLDVTALLDLPANGMTLLAKDESGGVSSHKARAATTLVRCAVLAGCRGITVGSCGNYGQAVATACRPAGLEATVVLPASYDVDDEPIRAAGAMVIREGATYEDAVSISKELAARSGFADGNLDGSLSGPVRAALARIALELRLALPGPPSAIWVPMGNGTTVAAIGGIVLDLGWPTRVYGVSSTGNNSILASPDLRDLGGLVGCLTCALWWEPTQRVGTNMLDFLPVSW